MYITYYHLSYDETIDRRKSVEVERIITILT